ncbi:MAG TPA: radical SAM protein [Geoalkalibacter subterraneus]|uniref:Radical SAM protein n=1 Tax=Geoalkalibacter subterraneus TaxID=483547 RepID=A0A831LHD9_9BACT|nr:radical SAM protein [Geoalkalibacter subterraneus]
MQIFPLFLPHQGCPHRCCFCDQRRTTQQFCAFEHGRIESELAEMIPGDGPGEGEIAFYGGTFTLLPTAEQQALLKLALGYMNRGLVRGIRVSTRPDALEDCQVEFLVGHGVTTVEIGAQSFDDRVLNAAGRGHDAVSTLDAVERLRKAGMKIGLQLMPGLPGSSFDEALFSLRTAFEARPEFLRIYPTVVFPGTELESLWRRGLYRPWSLNEAVDVCADMLKECRRHSMPVIRLGLQQVEGLECGGVAAGPHHPAFGQLVRSQLWYNALMRLLSPLQNETAPFRVRVSRADLGDILGHRRTNIEKLQKLVPGLVFEGCDDLRREHLAVEDQLFHLDTLLQQNPREEKHESIFG